MKQLYYTSCVPGRSASGQGGFQIRAASPSLTAERRRGLLSHVGYRLPCGFDEDTRPDDAPARLALLDTDSGRVLLRSGYVGRDPTTNRTGNFFSHVLADLPTDCDAVAAAQLFDAPFWVRSDGAGPIDLPELAALPSVAVPPQKLAGFAAEHGEVIRFLFLGLLSAAPHQRLFVVAHPEDVALAVIVVGRMLPPELRKGITFSTYEREPLSSPARIVGAYWRDATLDLEGTCYDGAGISLNTISGRSSPLPTPSPFAKFALEAIEQRREGDLAKFYSQCHDFPLVTPAALDLAFRLVQSGKEVTREEFVQTLAYPEMARGVCGRSGVVDQIVQWGLQDATFRAQHFAAASRHVAPVSRLIAAIVRQVVTLSAAQDFATARVTLDELPARAASDAVALVHDELARVVDRASLSDEAHFFLLPYLLQAKGASAEARDRWLYVPPARLPRLLDLPLTDADKLRACELSLARNSPPAGDEAWSMIAARETLLRALLERHGGARTDTPRTNVGPRLDQEACGALISAALAGAAQSKGRAGLLERGKNLVRNLTSTPFAPASVVDFLCELVELHDDGRLSTSLLNDALDHVFRSPEFNSCAFLASKELRWLDDVPKSSAQVTLAERVLESAPLGIQAAPTRAYLHSLRKSVVSRSLSAEHQQSLADVARLADYLDAPTLDDADLRDAMSGIKRLRDSQEFDACHKQALKLASEQLLDDKTPAESLERLLDRFTLPARKAENRPRGWFSSWFGGKTSRAAGAEWLQTYLEITALLKTQSRTCRNPELVVALAAVGLGGVPRSRFSPATLPDKATRHELAEATADFLRALASKSRDREFEELDRYVHRLWRKEAPSALRRWTQAFQPRERKGWLDFLIYVIFTMLGVVVFVKFVLPLLFADEVDQAEVQADKSSASQAVERRSPDVNQRRFKTGKSSPVGDDSTRSVDQGQRRGRRPSDRERTNP